MNLESFLLKPMQRVTKIPLLVKNIVKYSAEGIFFFLFSMKNEYNKKKIII